jgi:hypothetical protein
VNRRPRTHRQRMSFDFDEAVELLRRPGCVLVDMKAPDTKSGRRFFVVPGGPVTDEVAKQILVHPLCHEADPGLFRGIPQSYSLYFGDEAKRTAHLSRHGEQAGR